MEATEVVVLDVLDVLVRPADEIELEVADVDGALMDSDDATDEAALVWAGLVVILRAATPQRPLRSLQLAPQ